MRRRCIKAEGAEKTPAPLSLTQRRQSASSTASRRTAIRRFWWKDLATRAAHEGSGQRDREVSSDRCDRVFDVPLGDDVRPSKLRRQPPEITASRFVLVLRTGALAYVMRQACFPIVGAAPRHLADRAHDL